MHKRTHPSVELMTMVTTSWVTVVTIVAVLATPAQSGFETGRVPPAEFDMVELNGFYEPEAAAKLCDQHPTCAGFTYRGLLNATNLKENTFDTFFFRYIFSIEKSKYFANWISYSTTKAYGFYNGTLIGGDVIRIREKPLFGQESFSKLCPSPDCAALVLEKSTNRIVGRMNNVNLNMSQSFSASAKYATLVNLDVDPEYVTNTQPDLDQCCPLHKDEPVNPKKWISEVNENIQRIPCSISKEEFVENYLDTRVPIILEGCLNGWNRDVLSWTADGVLRKFSNHSWIASIIPRDLIQSPDENAVPKFYKAHVPEIVDDFPETFSSEQILTLMHAAPNVTLRLFDKVGVAPRRPREFSSSSTEKRDIRKEWKWPAPVPRDLLAPALGGSDYQWIIIGSAYTGTKCHIDPQSTDAWNALIQGHKYWVIFPKDVPVEDFNCDNECSAISDEQEVFALPWYKHVLPQLRQKTWYGQRLIEVIQRPGDMIYVPSLWGHVVMNLDDTVSVTENFLGIRAVKDELPVLKAINGDLFEWTCDGCLERIWRNLMTRELRNDSATRAYANRMLQQAKEHYDLLVKLGLDDEDGEGEEDEEDVGDSDHHGYSFTASFDSSQL